MNELLTERLGNTLRVQFDSEHMPAKKTIEGAVRVHLREPMPQVVTIPITCNRPISGDRFWSNTRTASMRWTSAALPR